MMKNFFILSHSFAIFIFLDQLSAIVALTLKHNPFCAMRKSKKLLCGRLFVFVWDIPSRRFRQGTGTRYRNLRDVHGWEPPMDFADQEKICQLWK